jgi:periplasmic divalent cation tolerance protein
MEEYIQVLTTTATKEEAQKIADTLVENRLAGCVQVAGPIVSTFWWKGKIERAEEWLCVMKSKRSLYDALERSIKAHHTYETPEVIAIPVVAGSQEYLQWLDHALDPGSGHRSSG